MEKYESPTIEQVGGVGNPEPEILIMFFYAALFAAAAMWVVTVDILLVYDTVYTPSRNINQ